MGNTFPWNLDLSQLSKTEEAREFRIAMNSEPKIAQTYIKIADDELQNANVIKKKRKNAQKHPNKAKKKRKETQTSEEQLSK